MGTKMVKAGAVAAAAALAAGVAGMFGGTAFAGGKEDNDEWVSHGKGDDGVSIHNGPRCGINAFIPIDLLIAANTSDQYACLGG
jgi:hypothetical protein